MASRLLLLPGGLRQEHIGRIREQPFWGSLWPGKNREPWYICICESGRRGRRWEGEELKTTLDRLLQPKPGRFAVNYKEQSWENNSLLGRSSKFFLGALARYRTISDFENKIETLKTHCFWAQVKLGLIPLLRL
jgi:hypothetical protein